jgi:hypothetical protein
MRKTMLLFLSVSLIIAGCQSRYKETGNLIVNPGFEEPTEGFPSGWIPSISQVTDTFRLGVTDESVHAGEKAMEIGRAWTESWEMNGIKTEIPIPVDPSQKYILSFWYKTDRVNEYPIPLVAGFRVNREGDNPLRYSKFLSTRDNWTQIYWLLDTIPPNAISTDLVFHLWIRTKGSVFLDDIEFRIADKSDIAHFEEWRRIPAPVPLGKASPNEFEGSGYFRVEKDSSRWWLVDPEGRPSWAIATMGEIPGRRGNGNVKLSEWFEREYQGDRMKYANMQYELLESWGFNSLAGWTANEFAGITEEKFIKKEAYLPMYRVLNFSIMGADKDYYAKDNKGQLKGVHDHSFPDPFNPDWRNDARKKAEEMIREFKGDPWFVGWFMDNEIDYSSLFEYIWGDYSAIEFIHFLENKYQDISRLNESWTSPFGTYNYVSFRDILSEKPEPVEWDDPLYEDFTAFERIMMKEYINYTFGMVKELDPDHLLISNRLNLDPMMCLYRTIDLWSRYDVICVNIYPENLYMGFDKGELEILEWVHRETGKPIIIGEWSVPALDSKLYGFGKDPYDRSLDWSWPQVMRNQSERAEVYRTCMLQFASRPYMIGAAWFKVLDVDSPTRRANRGLIDSEHQPYEKMIEVVRATNREIQEKFNISR